MRKINQYDFKYVKLISIPIITIIVLIAVYYINPYNSSFLPKCPFNYITKLYCPGCGTTRALHEITHFNFIKALSLNILTVLFIPLLIYSYIRYLIFNITEKKIFSIFKSYVCFFILAIILIFWILRNIPIFPFTLLAP